MKAKKSILNPSVVFLTVTALAFVLFTLLTNQFVEISSEVGLAGWLKDTMIYVVGYKFGYKLIASMAVGTIAFVATQLIRYGSMRSAKKRARATRLDFVEADAQITKTA